MGEVIAIHLTKRAIYQEAKKEMERLFKLSAGGIDPLIDESSREMFERGEIDEVRWRDWNTYCAIILNKLRDYESITS